MSESNIFISTDALKGIVSKLREERNRISELLEVESKATDDMTNFFGGTCGDKAYEKLKRHNLRNDKIIKNMDNRISFLESVIESYEKIDKDINSRLEQLAK